MSHYPDPHRHDPPQVLTVAAVTCRTCGGEQTYRNADDELCHCHACENGYEKVLLPLAALLRLAEDFALDPGALHREVVREAERGSVRLPVLTHNTAQLAPHLLPRRPRPQSRTEAK